MLDLDNFKVMNDRMGHQAGNELLRRIAQALVAAGRDSDQVFRYGGDEFVAVLPATDTVGAQQVAERVRAALRELKAGSGRDDVPPVTASIGIATFPADGQSAAQILLAADRACYLAKRAGRDRIATADEGLDLVREFTLQDPTPVDPPTPAP
jgi:diguanylate cyclase (GGDEF)-like protein